MQYLWEQLHKLEPTSELGGIYAPKTGYHDTRDNNPPNNYSVVDSQDKGGPGNLAAALDWTFPEAQHGDYTRISKYAKRLLDSGKDPHDDRLNWMREFYGQADKDSAVEGWDYRYVVPVSSDSSHLWHIHFSFSRNALTTENMDKLLDVLTGGDMALSDADIQKIAEKVWTLDNVPKSPDAPKPPHEDPDYGDPDDPNTGNKHWAAKSYLRRIFESVDQALMNDDGQNTVLADIQAKVGDSTIVVGAELLKQVMLDPQVVETYAKAIGDQIIGLNYKRVE